MGIKGLLTALSDIIQSSHLEEFRGKSVAIDTYAWLHRAVYACSLELCLGENTQKHLDWCIQRLALLESFDIKPIFVFDGERLPLKSSTEESRLVNRQLNLQQGHAYLRAGNRDMATKHFQRAVDVTPRMAREFQKKLRQWLQERNGWEFASSSQFSVEEADSVFKTQTENTEVNLRIISSLKQLESGLHAPGMIVAPYEADAQLAYLSRTGLVHAVITEDSDLIVYGCQRIIFKLESSGACRTLNADDLARSSFLAPFLPFSSSTQTSNNSISYSGGNFRSVSPVGPQSPFGSFDRKVRNRSPIPRSFASNNEGLTNNMSTAFSLPEWACRDQFHNQPWRKKKIANILNMITLVDEGSMKATANGISPLLLILQVICALAGCDYLSSMPGIGIVSARDAVFRAVGDVPTVLEGLRRHILALVQVQLVLLRRSEEIVPKRQKILEAWSQRENWWGVLWPNLVSCEQEKCSESHKTEVDEDELSTFLLDFQEYCKGPLSSDIHAAPLCWSVCPEPSFYAALALLSVRELTRSGGNTNSSFARALSPSPNGQYPLSPENSGGSFYYQQGPLTSAVLSSSNTANTLESSNSNPIASQSPLMSRIEFMERIEAPQGEAQIDDFLAWFNSQRNSDSETSLKIQSSTPPKTLSHSTQSLEGGLKSPVDDKDSCLLPNDFFEVNTETVLEDGEDMDIDEQLPMHSNSSNLGRKRSLPGCSSGNSTPRSQPGFGSPGNSQSFRPSPAFYSEYGINGNGASLKNQRISLQRSGTRSTRGIAGAVSWAGWGTDAEEIGSDLKFIDSQSQEVISIGEVQGEEEKLRCKRDQFFVPVEPELLNGTCSSKSAFELLRKSGSNSLLPRSPVVNYARAVIRCLLSFNHQVVFDPVMSTRVHLGFFANTIEDPTIILAIGTRARRQARLAMQSQILSQRSVQQKLEDEFARLPSPPPNQPSYHASYPQEEVLEWKKVENISVKSLGTLCLNIPGESQSQLCPVTTSYVPADSPSAVFDQTQSGRISLGRARTSSPPAQHIKSPFESVGGERISLSKRSSSRTKNCFIPIASPTPSESLPITLAVSRTSNINPSPNQLVLEPISRSSRVRVDASLFLDKTDADLPKQTPNIPDNADNNATYENEDVDDPTIKGVDPSLWSLTSLHPMALFASLKEILLSTCLHARSISLTNEHEIERCAQQGKGGYLGWFVTQGKARAHALGLLQMEGADNDIKEILDQNNQFTLVFDDLSSDELEAVSILFEQHSHRVQERRQTLVETQRKYEMLATSTYSKLL